MGTFTVTGTGGIIEGNLGPSNVNVNLDPVYGNFNGSTSSVNAGSPTMFDDIFNGAGTIMAWIYPKSDGEDNFGRIFDKNQWILNVRDELSGFVRLNFSANFSGDDGTWKTTDRVVPLNAWSHIAIVYDGSSVSNDPIVYVNGVAQTLTEGSTPTGSITSDASSDLYIGNNSSGTRTFDGYIMDAKIYKASGVSSTQVPIAAAKINQSPDLISPNPPKGWYKFNASTTADSSGNSNTASASNMGSVVYDAFSVNVYDNSTTTDGTFTVTQGKVECKALTSVDFESDQDYGKIAFASTITQSHDNMSIACWIKRENATGQDDTILGKSDLPHHHYFQIDTDGDIRYKQYPNTLDTGAVVTDTNWHHIIVTLQGDNNGAIYLDGVAQTLTTNTVTADGTFDQIGLRGDSGDGAATADEFDGKIRDLKFFDYALSADQAASLYSGTYPQTPKHHYKLDEGSGGNGDTVADTGTATTNNGTLGPAGHAPNWSNGTLDLDGTTSDQLRISANGTLSAPRGNLAIGGAISATVNSFENYGTFIHNNGTVTFDATADYGQRIQETASAATAFYNVTHNRSASSYHLYIKGDITIENILLNQVGFVNLYGPNTLTMGTTSSAGAITMTSSGIRFYNNDSSNYAKIYGASSIYPFVYTGNEPDIDTYSSNASHVAFKNGDIQVNMTSDYQGGIVRLDGDMEFDAVSVQSGDDFDLNGQRAQFSSNFRVESGGAMKSTGGGLIVAGADVKILGSAEGIHDGDVNMIVEGGTHDWRNGAADGVAPWCRTVLVNGNITHQDQLGGSSGNHNYNPESVIVGNGKLTQSGGHAYLKDLTIAKGGDFEMTQSTQKDIDLSGDFTKSGGLIGKSALDFDAGSNPYVDLENNAAWQFGTNNFTLEAWFRSDTNTGLNRTIIANGDAGDNGFLLYMQGDGNIKFFVNNIAVANAVGPYENDSKWHHVAAVRDGNDYLLYIDGKLIDKSTQSAQNLTHNGKASIGARDLSASVDAFFDGQIAMVRVFKGASGGARTQSEIRADMFNNSASLADSTDLMCAYDFNEGTGTSLDNIQGNTNFDGTITNATWVGAGTFTQSTSTLIFAKSGAQTLNYYVSDNFNNITVNAGSTTTLTGFGLGSGAVLDCFGNLVVSGTLASTANNEIMKLRTAGKTHDFSGTLTGLYQIIVDISSGSLNIPALTTPRLRMATSVTGVATGNHTITEELQIDTNTTFNANDKTITAKLVDLNDGTFNLGAGSLQLTGTGGSDGFDTNAASVLIAGPGCTVGGDASGQKVNFKSQNGFQIVGDIDDLNVTNEELTVIGTVTNCTGDILQFTPGHDTTLSLETDTAEDRDIRLGGPSLDNANHLVPE